MEEIKNIGYIYKITNLINGKIYIGQTSKTIEERFKGHKIDSARINKECYNYPLYKAFRKYGIDNFKVEEIEKCEIDMLNEKEIYWISFYDSFNKKKGYNMTLGGAGNKSLDLNEEDVLNKYKEFKTLTSTSNYFNCSNGVIKAILLKHNVDIQTALEYSKTNAKTIYQYDLNNNLINIFESYTNAGEWLLKNNLSKASNSEQAGFNIVTRLLLDKNIYKGYFWKFEEDYPLEYKIKFKTRYYNRSKCKTFIKKSICSICGSECLGKRQVCKKCLNDKKMRDFENKKNISREILKDKIRTKSFLQIGEEYGVSDNAIRKWCKKYNLPFKTSEIKSYSDEEWKKL